MDIRFGDHASFHKAALGMVGSSLLFGMALSPATSWPVAPIAGGVLGIACGAAIAHGKAPLRMLAAAAACVPLFVMPLGWPMLAVIASVLALGVAVAHKNLKGLLSLGLGAGVALLGMWCALKISTAFETRNWPEWIKYGASAAAFGMVGVIAMLPRHLRLALDPVAAAVRNLPANLDPEVKGLCDRSVAIWNTTKDKLADNDSGKTLVRDGVLKTLEVAAKSAEVKLTGASDLELASRMDDFDKRIAAATDPEVKVQYQQARAALDDQRRYRDHIRQGRERLVARMHNHVTTLEKFQLAATGLEATRASTTAATRQLDELSQDVAASGEALAEVELGVESAADAKAPTLAERVEAAENTPATAEA
jgi:hypothetical protein